MKKLLLAVLALHLCLPAVFAQSGNLLDITSRVTPVLSFQQSYSERVVIDPELGPEVVPVISTTVQIVASMDGINQEAFDDSTAIGFSFGDFVDGRTLGE